MGFDAKILETLKEVRDGVLGGVGWKEAVDGWRAMAELYKDESLAEVAEYLDGCAEVQVQRKEDEEGKVVQLFCRARLEYNAPAVFARGENLAQVMENAVELLRFQHEAKE